jgi:hypothetical protein
MGRILVEDRKLSEFKLRLRVEDFHKRGEAGIFGEDARVELIEGPLDQDPSVCPLWHLGSLLDRSGV